jgi:hypothetical protein
MMRAATVSTGFLGVVRRTGAVCLVAVSAISGTVVATCTADGRRAHPEASAMAAGGVASTPRRPKPNGDGYVT